MNTIMQTLDKDTKKNIRIILIDDSDFSRKTMAEILESEGYSVVGQANSAEKALQVVQTAQAEIFIIDVVMPGVSGIELAKLLFQQFEETKIIMVSSLKVESIIIEAISTGAVDFITKPFEKETLLSSIEKVASDILASRKS